MRIASRETVPGRVHEAAGKSYTFNPEQGTDQPMIAFVPDPAAQAVFLHDRNRNMFYALDLPGEVALTRKVAAPAYGSDENPLANVLEQNAPAVLQAVADFTVERLTLVRAMEAAGKNRKGVLAGIDELIGEKAAAQQPAQQETPPPNAEQSDLSAQVALILENAAVLAVIEQVTDKPLLEALLAQETAGAARNAVMDLLKQRIG